MVAINNIFCTCILLAVHILAASKIPSYITVCSKNDPDLRTCILANSEAIRVHLRSEGIPEIKLGRMDPVVTPVIAMDRNNIHAAFNNLTIHNATQYILKSFNIDFENISLDLVLEFPKVNLESDYILEGRILILQLKGHGNATATIDDIHTSVHITGVKKFRRNKLYYDLDNYTVEYTVGNAQFMFNNLFGENQALTEATNRVINENWADFLDELMPMAKEILGSIVYPVVRNFFNTFSIDELFPDNL